MSYSIFITPGMGLSIICHDCVGESRDLLGFSTYITKISSDELNDLIAQHEDTHHLRTDTDI